MTNRKLGDHRHMTKAERLERKMATHLTCINCELTAPKSSFTATLDGYFRNICRACERAQDTIRQRDRYQKQGNPLKWSASLRAAQKRNRAKTKHQDKARQSTKRAMAKGLIKKLPCAICKNSNSVIHHLDYNDPLNIMWLCPRHHLAWHRVFIPEAL